MYWRILAVLLALTWLAQAIEGDKISVNGYSSFEFEKQLEKEGDGGGDAHASFDADLFDLVFNFQAADQVRAAADMTWEHGAATEDGRGNVALEYGFVEYAVSDLLKIRFGKMFTPFGTFNEIHTAKPAFLSVKEAAGTNKPERIVTAGYRFFPRWGTGIALRGDGVLAGKDFDYDILIANGEQENTNPFEEDDNQAKSITTRFRVEPSTNLRLGNSFYFDRLGEPGFDYLLSEGVELQFTRRRLQVLLETVVGFKKPSSAAAIKQLGWFVQPSYHLASGAIPYLRLDFVDPDLNAADDQGFVLILGVQYEFAQGLIAKVEHNYFSGADDSSLGAFPNNDYNEIKAALVLGF